MYLKVSGLKKSFGTGGGYNLVLRGVDTGVERGEICVILGSSGCGKSTFLNSVGGLDTIDEGSIVVDGMEIGAKDAKQLARYRKENLGFIFQFYNLLPDLTVRENIQICENISQDPLDIDELLATLGLTEMADRFPSQLSGGQQQRCAIARALVKNPKLLLCDEPTGALDSRTSSDILVLLEGVNRKYGTTMLMVTHNQAIADMAHRVIIMHDGVVEQTIVHEHPKAAADMNVSGVLLSTLSR